VLLTQPPKICPRCRREIPGLVCAACAQDALPLVKGPARRRRPARAPRPADPRQWDLPLTDEADAVESSFIGLMRTVDGRHMPVYCRYSKTQDEHSVAWCGRKHPTRELAMAEAQEWAAMECLELRA
jgi:hypothetical protein